jgi:nucleotide-binding universal stress UspA family protein
MENQLQAEVKEILKEDHPSFDVELIVTDMAAGEQIIYIADAENIDQLYVGIEKKSKVGKLLFGSTLQYLILHAHCPVVSVQKDYKQEE